MDVTIPDFAESVSEGDLGRWLRSNGDVVRKDEPLLEIETDKTTLEVPAPASGRLSIEKQEGETVTSGDLVGRIDESAAGEESSDRDEGEDGGGEPTGPAKSEGAGSERSEPEGSSRDREPAESGASRSSESAPPRPGRAGGEEPSGRRPEATPSASPARRPTEPEPNRPDEPGTRRERMSRLRRSIAQRLVEAQQTAAILTTFNEVDMSALIELRKQNQEWFQARHGVKLGYVSLFGKAVVAALREVPEINSFVDGDELVHHDHVHLGVAVGTDRGLVVPVVRNADSRTLGDLEKEIQRLAIRAREGELELSELQGGTFTISNGGIYGSMLSTPILNPPQSGILGMHAIEQRPRVLADGSIAARPMMYVALSYDHRIVDGKEAVTFLVNVKQRLEDPERMLLES